jgi:hypothetical protein
VLLSYYVAEENEVHKDPVQTCAYSFNLIIPKSPDYIISQSHNLLISKIQINRGISSCQYSAKNYKELYINVLITFSHNN